ncbi:MAG: hypothetical protein HS105_02000 [Chloracidobacterium sp.]|nr:hypothetical protein [Chloracidobacterium sp.]MCC6824181.1 hypothetical protein [Acidobacteriota bacterium]MCO5334476.1 hypothetical protein [Pyrinomonadaceae bacterium]
MTSWEELVEQGNFSDAERPMLIATDGGGGLAPDCATRAGFYENWAEHLDGYQKNAKYQEALVYLQMYAMRAPTGEEEAARTAEVDRVQKIVDELEGD